MNTIITSPIWFYLWIIWSLPLFIFRSRFRRIVYQTDHWIIDYKPIFMKELKGLWGNLYPGNRRYIRSRNQYRLYLIIYFLLLGAWVNANAASNKKGTMETIVVGSKVPSFKLLDQFGNIFDLDSVLGKKNLVIYFYPKDDTPGCTKEACSFRDQFDAFVQADALVIGISGQSVESHLAFAQKHRLNFTLLSDEGNRLRKQFGVPTNFWGLLPGRVTYVVNKVGEVVLVFNSQLQSEKHIEEALRILKSNH